MRSDFDPEGTRARDAAGQALAVAHRGPLAAVNAWRRVYFRESPLPRWTPADTPIDRWRNAADRINLRDSVHHLLTGLPDLARGREDELVQAAVWGHQGVEPAAPRTGDVAELVRQVCGLLRQCGEGGETGSLRAIRAGYLGAWPGQENRYRP